MRRSGISVSERVGGQNFRGEAAASFTFDSFCRIGFYVALKCRHPEGYTLWNSVQGCGILLRSPVVADVHLCTIT